jgi:CRISPR-associated protein Csy1
MNPIVDFLDDRKKDKLKNPKKPIEEIEADFTIVNWVGKAVENSYKLHIVSHAEKFSHPEAKEMTSILFEGQFQPDGYLRSGNVQAPLDTVCNAADLGIDAFLSIVLEGGKTVFEHFEECSELLKGLLNVSDELYHQWCNLVIKAKESSISCKTHPYVKQVYFPSEGQYLLLSVLTPSGIVTENKKRLRKFKAYAEDFKPAREARKKKHYHATGYADMPKLLIQKFGGSNARNISKLNMTNGGQAWLLPCFPPEIGTHYTRLPKTDFFKSLPSRNEHLQDLLKALHRLFKIEDYTNKAIRQSRKKLMTQVFEWVLGFAMRVQEQPAGWSNTEGFELPLVQRLWLDSAYQEQRDLTPDWQTEIAEQLSDWLIVAYNRLPKENNTQDIHLGEEEHHAFTQELLDFVAQNEEFIL